MESLNQEEQIKSTINYLYKTLKNNLKLFLSITFVFIGLSIVYFTIKKPVYKSEMIVTSSLITSERLAIIIEPLGDLANEQNFSELSRLMNIDSITASKIKSIDAKEIKDMTKSSSTENFDSEVLRQQNCMVILKIKSNPKLADTIQSGVLNYLRNNNYIKRKSTTERQSLEFMSSRIQQEIKALDTLKKKISNSNTGMSMMDPSAINNSIADLYNRELGIKSKILLEDGGINIIRDVSKFKTPIEPKLWVCILVGFISSIFTTIIFIIFIEFKKKYLIIE